MKNKYVFVEILLTLLVALGIILVHAAEAGPAQAEDKRIKVVTSFYPMYIAMLNVTEGLEHVELQNLTEPQTGCLHDYQLVPRDMITLSGADLFIINGGGIESFMQEVSSQYPDLPVAEASEGIHFLTAEADEETLDEHAMHAHEGHTHEINAHVWMDISKYMQQVQNMVREISEIDPEHKSDYEKNGASYIGQLEALKERAEKMAEGSGQQKIILFHDSFAYFAEEFGLDIEYILDMDEDSSLSAGQVARLIRIIEEQEVRILFTEAQYGTKIADAVAGETKAEVFVLDSLVTGDGSKDSYLTGMEYNLGILKEAVEKWQN